MEWNEADDVDRTTLTRIVSLLVALADLAELTVTRSPAIRVLVLWLLLPAEAVVRNLVTAAPAPCPLHHAGLTRADAMRLARRLRNLARTLDRQLAPACALRCRGFGMVEPAWLDVRWSRRLEGALGVVASLVFRAPMRVALDPAAFPDTS